VRRLPPILFLLLFSAPVTLPAQWRVTLFSGTASSHGDSRDDSDPAHPQIRADAPATLALSLTQQQGAWQGGLEFHHISADLGETSASTAVATRDVLKAWGAALEVSRRIAGEDGHPTFNAVAGAGVDRWTFDLGDDSPRWRLSARGALELAVPVTPAWSVVIRGQAIAGPSVFNPEDLPEGFVQLTALRVGLMLGVSRRF
jgi:hypothetical protein